MSNFPFRVENILEQCGGSADTAVTVLDEFLNQVPADEAEMKSGFASQDLLTTSRAAHRLKGTAGVLGADKLHHLCASLEIAAKENRVNEAQETFAQLQLEAENCIDYVPAAKRSLNK